MTEKLADLSIQLSHGFCNSLALYAEPTSGFRACLSEGRAEIKSAAPSTIQEIPLISTRSILL